MEKYVMTGSSPAQAVLVALDDSRVCLRLSVLQTSEAPWYFATDSGWQAAGQARSAALEAAWVLKQKE